MTATMLHRLAFYSAERSLAIGRLSRLGDAPSFSLAQWQSASDYSRRQEAVRIGFLQSELANVNENTFRSLVRHVSKRDVIDAYTRASRNTEEHDKHLWGSSESMVNRFQLALKVLDWQNVRRWLDVGCGAGLLFAIASKANLGSVEMVGVDFTPAMIEEARRHQDRGHAAFINADLEDLPADLGLFEVVTAIGVLQQCSLSLDRALAALAAVTAPGGQLFLDTKNLGWRSFREEGLVPEPQHSWFDWDELRESVTASGFEIVTSGGFLPREGHIVAVEDSHTVFLVAKRSR